MTATLSPNADSRSKSFDPSGPDPRLVDLVHRERRPAQREGRGAGEGDAATRAARAARATRATRARLQLGGEDVGQGRRRPLLQRVGRAAGTGEDVGRAAHLAHGPLPYDRVDIQRPEAGDLDRVADALAEVVDRAGRQLIGVLLEAVGRVEHDGPDVTRTRTDMRGQPVEQPTVDLCHRRRRLSRPHDREQPGKSRHTPLSLRTGRRPTRSPRPTGTRTPRRPVRPARPAAAAPCPR